MNQHWGGRNRDNCFNNGDEYCNLNNWAFLVGKGRRSERAKKAEGEKKSKALLLSLLLSIAFSYLSSTKPWERVHLFLACLLRIFSEHLKKHILPDSVSLIYTSPLTIRVNRIP